MVLKIATGTGWLFVDGVKRLDVRPTTNIDGLVAKDIIFTHNRIKENGDIESTETGCNYPAVRLFATMENSDADFYFADLAVYLMSNDGKTIERVN